MGDFEASRGAASVVLFHTVCDQFERFNWFTRRQLRHKLWLYARELRTWPYVWLRLRIKVMLKTLDWHSRIVQTLNPRCRRCFRSFILQNAYNVIYFETAEIQSHVRLTCANKTVVAISTTRCQHSPAVMNLWSFEHSFFGDGAKNRKFKMYSMNEDSCCYKRCLYFARFR